MTGIGRNATDLSVGYSVPTSGKWGDRQTGYKPALDFRLDWVFMPHPLIGVGFGTSLGDYKSRGYTDPNRYDHDTIGVMHLTPFMRWYKYFGKLTLRTDVGVGLYRLNITSYQRISAHNTDRTEFGFNGSLCIITTSEDLEFAFGLRWHHIINGLGPGVPINNIAPIISSGLKL